MKTRNKILSLICLVAMLFSVVGTVAVYAEEYVKEAPVDPQLWENPNFEEDHAYSFAFVGDTQFITIGDYLLGTEKLKYQFKAIADTVEERKLEHVFYLGDMTDWGYRNDGNLAAAHNYPPITGEWDVVRDAVFQLNGKGITYSLVRGNHDDYMMDDYFNVPEYTDQFYANNGGFFSDVNGKHGGKREVLNPGGNILWSALSGVHEESVVNSWMEREIAGTKYLFVTVDYNPTVNVMNWLNELLPKYPDHKVILTMHSYLLDDGTLSKDESGNTMYITPVSPQVLWDRCISKHANVFMVVSGHTGGLNLSHSYQTGVNGNRVLQVLVDPQGYETRETDKLGTLASGKQDVGLVLYMNFSKDGKTISFDYYSTLLDKFLKDNDYVIPVEPGADETGYIDMAGFADFGQETPLVTETKTPNLDGNVTDGEYSYSKTTGAKDLGKGMLNGDLTEYFAYDNDYIYYAFKTTDIHLGTYKLNLHFGSSLYTREQLNGSVHPLMSTYEFTPQGIALAKNSNGAVISDSGSHLLEGDMDCAGASDKNTKTVTYEFKIRRGYLRDNGSPDNLLAYTLEFGNVAGSTATEHYFKLTNEAKAQLEELGVTKKFLWTYNYAYFGTRPEASEVPPLTTAPVVTEAPAATDPVDEGGCGSSLALASVAAIPVIAGAVVLSRKKKEN